MTWGSGSTAGWGQSSGSDRSWAGVTALVLGLISMLAWLLPICGGPTSVTALVLGFMGLSSSRRGLAIAGIVLGGVGLALTVGNAALGILMALNQ